MAGDSTEPLVNTLKVKNGTARVFPRVETRMKLITDITN